KDKKNRTCERYEHTCATLQKLCEHLNRQNPCRSLISPVLLPQHQSTLPILRKPKVLDIPEMIQNPEQNANDKKPEQEFFGEPEIEIERQVSHPVKSQFIKLPKTSPKTQAHQEKKNEQSKKTSLEIDLTNEEFERLSMITGDHEKSIIFREQILGKALKR
ncbi:1572_t:CDS:2, partial [Ambispora gerdemannii]